MDNPNKANWKKYRLGNLSETKYGQRLFLGSKNNTDPKYNYTVRVMILDANGNKVKVFENPVVKLTEPRNKKEGSKLMYELSVSVKEE